MNDLADLSLADLRDLARHLRVHEARRLSRAELLLLLAPQAAEALRLAARPLSGRLVLPTVPVAAMTASEPVGAGAPTTSGAGRRTPEPLRAPDEPIPDLPWAYEDDRVVLLVRDPRTLYTYWDLHPGTIAAAAEGLDGARSFLRVWMLGQAPVVVFEFEVDLGGRAYYVYDCEPNREYRVQLVFRGRDGAERQIGHQSNVAHAPPNAPSTWIEDRFVSIPLDVELPAGAVFTSGGRVPPEPEKRLHARAYELSGGEAVPGENDATSSGRYVKGFGGRHWSGTLVRK